MSYLRLNDLLRGLSIYFLTIITLSACCEYKNNHEKPNTNNIIGKEITLPDTKYYKTSNNNKNGYKLVSCINGDCYACIHNLTKWQSIIDQLTPNTNASFIFYIVTMDSMRFKEIINRDNSIKFDHPISFDPFDKFRKDNLLENFANCSFLLNENNVVLLVGDPTHSKSVRDQYLNIIINNRHE